MGQSYEIRVRGRLTERVRRALAPYAVRADDVSTALSVDFKDNSELQSFLIVLDELGLEVVDLRQVPDRR